jgi:hypothetical protein
MHNKERASDNCLGGKTMSEQEQIIKLLNLEPASLGELWLATEFDRELIKRILKDAQHSGLVTYRRFSDGYRYAINGGDHAAAITSL